MSFSKCFKFSSREVSYIQGGHRGLAGKTVVQHEDLADGNLSGRGNVDHLCDADGCIIPAHCVPASEHREINDRIKCLQAGQTSFVVPQRPFSSSIDW